MKKKCKIKFVKDMAKDTEFCYVVLVDCETGKEVSTLGYISHGEYTYMLGGTSAAENQGYDISFLDVQYDEKGNSYASF